MQTTTAVVALMAVEVSAAVASLRAVVVEDDKDDSGCDSDMENFHPAQVSPNHS